MAKKTLTAKIREAMLANPGVSVTDLMKSLRIPPGKKAQVYVVRSKIRKAAEAKPLKVATTKKTEEPVAHDPVNHPAHYTTGGIETIDFIEAKNLNYRLGNAVKYIARAAYKGNYAEDLKKAVWYIERELERDAKL